MQLVVADLFMLALDTLKDVELTGVGGIDTNNHHIVTTVTYVDMQNFNVWFYFKTS